MVSKYENVPEIWSLFEIQPNPKTKTYIRGLNSIQLHCKNGTWWIHRFTYEMESSDNVLISNFLNEK